jgi:hypothetical protein
VAVVAPNKDRTSHCACRGHGFRRSDSPDIAAKLTKAAEPKTELFDADGGRADLVLSFESPDFILIVEAKIDAEGVWD